MVLPHASGVSKRAGWKLSVEFGHRPVRVESGAHATIEDLAAAEKINASYVSRILRLAFLAPDIVEVILDSKHPSSLTAKRLMEPFPTDWAEQKRHLFG